MGSSAHSMNTWAPIHRPPTIPSCFHIQQLTVEIGPVGSANARIRIATKWPRPPAQPALFEDLWSAAVFELNNVNCYREWDRLRDEAWKGNLTCDEFVDAKLKSEERATQCSRAFYISTFLPWLEKTGSLKSNPFVWHCDEFLSEPELSRSRDDWRLLYYAAEFNSICAKRELGRENYSVAKEYLKKIFDGKDTLPEYDVYNAYAISARLNREVDDFEGAIKDCTSVLCRNPAYAESYLIRGTAHSYLGHFDQALEDFNQALRLKPDDVEVLRLRSNEFSRRREWKVAIADLSKAIVIAPRDSDLYLRRGWARGNAGELDHAVDDFTEAVKLAPKDPRGYQSRAKVFGVQGNRAKAIADLDTAIRFAPKNGTAFLERGTLHIDNRAWQLALGDFNSAIKLSPDSPPAYAARAKLRLESEDKTLRRPAEALRDAKRSCELTKWKSASELAILAAAYAALSDFDNAVLWQEKAASQSAPDERAKNVETLKDYRVHQKKRTSAISLPSSDEIASTKKCSFRGESRQSYSLESLAI